MQLQANELFTSSKNRQSPAENVLLGPNTKCQNKESVILLVTVINNLLQVKGVVCPGFHLV